MRALPGIFAVRDWDAMTEMLADDVCVEDRRRVVNAGIRRGRDAEMANMRATADVGVTFMTAVVIATRGERLVLTRGDAGNEERAEAFHTEVLALVEIDADERIAAIVSFDIDDIDAAFEELDARYLAGEAAAHAHTWSVITGGICRAQPARIAARHARLRRASTTVAAHRSRPVSWLHIYVPDWTSAKASEPTSRLCIG